MKKKVSIIVPIYNVEQYLQRCLASIQNQSYTQLQVILINDGSTDNSRDIALNFVKADDRYKLIDQKNQGLSAARNAGLPYVTGDYVFYLDSDDYITTNCLELLITKAVQYDADVVQTNFYYDYGSYLLYDNSICDDIIIQNREKLMEELLHQKYIKNFAWGKLIKTSIAKKYLFPIGKYFEDTYWMYYIVHECATYVVSPTPTLYYIQRNNSISGSFSNKNLDQIDGELLRAAFVKENYSLELYKLSIEKIIEKILFFKYLIYKNVDVEQRIAHGQKLYMYYEKLKNHIGYIDILKFRYNKLNILSILINRIKGRFFANSKHIRLNSNKI